MKLFYAFPGMGKTTWAMTSTVPVLDTDCLTSSCLPTCAAAQAKRDTRLILNCGCSSLCPTGRKGDTINRWLKLRSDGVVVTNLIGDWLWKDLPLPVAAFLPLPVRHREVAVLRDVSISVVRGWWSDAVGYWVSKRVNTIFFRPDRFISDYLTTSGAWKMR